MANQIPTVTTLALMERYLDGAARRQVLRMENLAQIDTPGYKAKDIPFEKHMEELVQSAEKGQASPERLTQATGLPSAEFMQGLAVRPDQNNVNLDLELRAMSNASTRFNVIIQVMQQKLRLIRSSINDTRG